MSQPEKLSGYTPGPWKAVKARTLIHIGGESPVCSLSVSTNHMGYEVRTSQELRDKVVRKVEANARLIAAAPEMFELLQDMKAILEDWETPSPLLDRIEVINAKVRDAT